MSYSKNYHLILFLFFTYISFNFSLCAAAIDAGASHTLVIDGQNNLWVFGSSSFGQLGLGNTMKQKIPTKVYYPVKIVKLAAGAFHSIILDENKEVWCFGLNLYGQPGLGDNNNYFNPTKLIGEDLYGVVDIAAGNNHSLLLDSRGQVWGFGHNAWGQLGFDASTQMCILPTKIQKLDHIIAIAAGYYYSLALDRDMQVWVFGRNEFGQLGFEPTQSDFFEPTKNERFNNIIAFAAGEDHVAALDNNGYVWTCGSNKHGQLGHNDTLNRDSPTMIENLHDIIMVTAGAKHTIALDKNGYVWVFGKNDFHQLGIQDNNAHRTPTRLEGLYNIVAIKAGDSHSLALDKEGQLWGFGKNHCGQLGLGEEVEMSTTPAKVPGPTPLLLSNLSKQPIKSAASRIN